ncbi:MAG TPA: hypothetical protein VFM71_12660 [Gemmatimonadaceae bacterium]|nr:hypothetical protein [Gemmatimonadaceae bacterium]
MDRFRRSGTERVLDEFIPLRHAAQGVFRPWSIFVNVMRNTHLEMQR